MAEKSEKNPKGSGRHYALKPTPETIKIVRGLGNIQATTKECAAVLGVTEPTYIKFKQMHPEVAEAYLEGSGQGLASLRRRQFKAADAGNPTMLIWLGKQYLSQADKQELTGAAGAAIAVQQQSSRPRDVAKALALILARGLKDKGDAT
jgi:hypothetical protein